MRSARDTGDTSPGAARPAEVPPVGHGDGHRFTDVASRPRPATPVALAFIDCINSGDVDGLGQLMTEHHQLRVFDEAPLCGREANVEGWHGYIESFPQYVIHPHRVAVNDSVVAVLGHTTGSHLGLSDEAEARLTMIWLVEVDDGAVGSWTLIEDNADNRANFGLDATEPLPPFGGGGVPS